MSWEDTKEIGKNEIVEYPAWHSYPKVFALGHRGIKDLLLDPVIVEEKIDGSQFSFGKFNGEVRARSRGCVLNMIAPEKMFVKGVETAQALGSLLKEGWMYRGEYLATPSHNTLAYDRTPKQYFIGFDINTGKEEYLPYEEKKAEFERLGLETVPLLFQGMLSDVAKLRELLETVSILGGQKVEGVVIKNYARFSIDGHAMIGKFVSEAFKEVHTGTWREHNPNQGDIVEKLIEQYKTPARWAKTVQHLKESGQLENSPKDIGLLLREVQQDVEAECAAEIKEKLYEWGWSKIRRGIAGGLPQWYKEQLMKDQFTNMDK
jgi:hypothetical protein